MRGRYLMVAVVFLSLVGAGHAVGVEPSADGLWQAVDDQTHQPNAWFLIRNRGDGSYEGLIVKIYVKAGEDPNVVCDQCKDDRHDKPWLGLDIIRGMKREGLNYTDGNILDPRYGHIYNAKMTLTPDGNTLVVRGYLGISLFGQDQYWTRLPESAYNEIDPRFNPNHTATTTVRKGPAAPKPANSAQR
jgi:uncharacterized protein (DUF2147 family)